MIHPVIHIEQHHVRFTPSAHLMAFHRQVRVSDTAAQQRHVGNNGLHEAVVGAPQDLSVRRLIHATGWITFCVHQCPAGNAFQQKKRLPQQDGSGDVHQIGSYIGFRKCDKPIREILHLGERSHLLRAQRQPKRPHSLQNGVLTIAVDYPNTGFSTADDKVPRHQIAVAAHAQQRVNVSDIVVVLV
ncbi:hypothetical protein SDC9_135720 [bioreactor metagenome]|uniref:Uncharacterized protein n=1 Tax=bioreactor metagenome TaxID=1076179 RepID=A0A645DH11_9ZZZZ